MLSRHFGLLADCLNEDGFMEDNSQERENFIMTLGKTACRMKSFAGCTRQPRLRVFFPNHRSKTCKSPVTVSMEKSKITGFSFESLYVLQK